MNAPAHLEDYLSRVRPGTASNILLWTIAAFFVVFLLWAGFTQLDRTIRGTGRVSPSSRLQVVSNLEGGIIDAILVRTGSIVDRGTPLVRLDRTATGSALSSSEAQYDALRAKIGRLEAEVAGRAPVFPGGADPAAAEQIGIEQALYRSRMADYGSMIAAAEARVTQSERSVAEASAALSSRRSALGAATTELNLIRPLVERGIEPRLSLVQAENAAAMAQGDAAAASAALTRTQSAVAEARATLARQRQDWRSQSAQELATAQGEMLTLRRQLPELSARVQRTTVRSPVAGRINRVLITTVGGTIAPGAPLVEVVPSEGSLIVEALIQPRDIAWIRIGQRAKINVTAYDSAIYGGLVGSVISISPDATTNEKTGESLYTVRVATREKLVDQLGRTLEIGPGMVAEVNLLGDKRSVLSYLLTPITRLSETAFREQ